MFESIDFNIQNSLDLWEVEQKVYRVLVHCLIQSHPLSTSCISVVLLNKYWYFY